MEIKWADKRLALSYVIIEDSHFCCPILRCHGYGSERERAVKLVNSDRTTPRHPSLAEIKTESTRNSSRLAGQSRATGDNVSQNQLTETHPTLPHPQQKLQSRGQTLIDMSQYIRELRVL
ncbi:hypothetical protein ACJJTC_010311 [Scirpophaga incertulas]